MKIIFTSLWLILISFYTQASFAIDLSMRPDIRDYIQSVSEKYHFDQAQLSDWFNQTTLLKPTLQKVKTPQKPTPFYIYRNAIITPTRVHAGIAYWEKHQKTLEDAEKRYGVPAKIIIGILGIETGYGKNTGHYSAFQSLATLAFAHPQRRSYFTSELTQYLLLCREHHWNPLTIHSSFDGGLGLPQFMPSSYRQYAVSTNLKRKPNLFTNNSDAIFSIANYLHAKGWQKQKPIALRAKIINKNTTLAMTESNQPQFTLAALQQHYGLIPAEKTSADLKVGLLALEYSHGKEWWIFFKNFSVIKTYNARNNYVMTIYELGNVISEKMGKKKGIR